MIKISFLTNKECRYFTERKNSIVFCFISLQPNYRYRIISKTARFNGKKFSENECIYCVSVISSCFFVLNGLSRSIYIIDVYDFCSCILSSSFLNKIYRVSSLCQTISFSKLLFREKCFSSRRKEDR